MSLKSAPNIIQKALQERIKRLEFEQLCLERQIKSLEQEVEKQLPEHNTNDTQEK
ncbi:MAG: hypothetical protein RIT27_452 [Pseudomonadota bacterium]|jgi:hypothetical protein